MTNGSPQLRRGFPARFAGQAEQETQEDTEAAADPDQERLRNLTGPRQERDRQHRGVLQAENTQGEEEQEGEDETPVHEGEFYRSRVSQATSRGERSKESTRNAIGACNWKGRQRRPKECARATGRFGSERSVAAQKATDFALNKIGATRHRPVG